MEAAAQAKKFLAVVENGWVTGNTRTSKRIGTIWKWTVMSVKIPIERASLMNRWKLFWINWVKRRLLQTARFERAFFFCCFTEKP